MHQQKEEEMEILGPRTHPNQVMEARAVGQAERVSKTEENQEEEAIIEDPPTSKFTWAIQHLSRVNLKKYYSDIFTVGGYKWRILMFPKGNNVDRLSMYLDVADASTLPYGWTRYAHFGLAVVNQIHAKCTVRKETQHNFTAWESDWGFTSFMPLSDLYDPAKGYLIHDTLIVEAEVTVQKSLDYWSYDSKKETGCVGLKNQGATCYMNSLLQTLYHMPYFRKAVYHMPTTENDVPSSSIPLALQSVFYKLQYSDTSVSTKDLTKSFGWDTYDSFLQHDVQELNRVLSEKLEDKMKGTAVEGTIQQLFEGHHMNYIECINVDYKSTRKESFYDLQLDVKGCRDVYASFDKYVEVERLEGDNKYHAEHYGLQEARKGVLFIDFPPVLQLQLKRFEYDFMRDTMVKRTFNAAAATPTKNKPDRPPHQPRSSVGSGSPLPSHIISISMPSSPAKFQMEQAKKVSFRTQKTEEDAKMSKLQNPSNVSLNFAKIKPRKQVKAYSQPIPTGNAYAEAMAKGTIPNFSVDRRNFDNRTKDNSYAYFKTRSGKIEHQLSRLRGKPVEGDGGVRPGDCEIESLPAGRYFDALQGPELEILRESEELVVPSNNKWPFLLRFPVSFFGVSLGVGSQAILWKTLAATPSMEFLHVPEIINLVLWCVALLTFIIILAVYISKCIFFFEAVRREYYHPVRVNFFFAPWIACMFLAIGLPPYIARSVHPVVWCVFMTPLLCLELKIYGQWMSGGDRRLSKVANPSNHLSIVGNFVGALLGAITGWKEGALFFFAVGLAHYIVLFVTLYQRLPTNETLPQDLHPVFFLFVAAPSVASVAWERIQGDFDSVSKIAYFIALFLYASLAVRLNFFRGFRFSIAWWAYTFPTTGAAIATIKYSNKIKHPFTQSLAVILAVISSLTVLSMLVSTLLHAFVWGTLFPNDIAIAITDRKGRARKKNKKSLLQQKETIINK